MDDLNFVVSLQHRRGPLRAANHILIEFYCDLLSFQIQTRDEFKERYVFLDLASFAIDLNAHGFADLTSRDR